MFANKRFFAYSPGACGNLLPKSCVQSSIASASGSCYCALQWARLRRRRRAKSSEMRRGSLLSGLILKKMSHTGTHRTAPQSGPSGRRVLQIGKNGRRPVAPGPWRTSATLLKERMCELCNTVTLSTICFVTAQETSTLTS